MLFFFFALEYDDNDSEKTDDYKLSSAILPLKLRIVLSDPFSDVSYLCVSYIYNDCHWMNQNHRPKMCLTSHFSDAYDAFSSSCFSFPLLSSLMTMTNV